LAGVNNTLAELVVQAIGYDVLFPKPTDLKSNQVLAESISNSESIYLPIGLAFSNIPEDFQWKTQYAYDRVRSDFLKTPAQKGISTPLYGTWTLMQYDPFAKAAFNSGHISAYSDMMVPTAIYL
jgi:hypothetical protein